MLINKVFLNKDNQKQIEESKMKTEIQQLNVQKIPKLRFSGFSDEWNDFALGGLLKYEQPTKYIVKNTEYSNEYKIPVLTAGKTFVLGYTNEAEGVFENDKLPVIIFDDFTTAKKFVDFPFKVKSSAMKILKNTNNTISDIRFIFLLMSGLNFSLGEEHKRFWISEYSKLKVLLPSLSEQKKIADFLQSVDALIKNLREQKENLEAYKKAIIKKIFSQDIRFKDKNGNNFPDWEEKKLSEVCKIIMGQSPDSGFYNSVGDGMYLIQGNADIKNRETDPRNWTTQATKECSVGDIIMTVRAPVGYVAKSIYDACIGRGVCAIRNNELSDIEFLYQFLLDFEKKWVSLEQGSTFSAVNTQDVKRLRIKMPCLDEQKKIADFLTYIDKVIESTQRQIFQVGQFKNSLLDSLFI